MIKVLPPKTTKEVVARERKARTTLLMALPEYHLAKFHKMADPKEMWEAIKSIFKGLYKGYDRFQTLLSQLEIHGAGVSHEDANQKFLRSLPSSWSQVALIMRTKLGLDTLSFDDLYNNLRVAMISIRIKKFHKRTGRKLQFGTKDLIGFDKTKVECFNCHKIGHFARDCRAKGNQNSKRKDVGYNGNKTRDNGRRPAYQDDSKALVTINRKDINWSGHVEEDTQNYAMMAYSSSNSGSDKEVKSCSKACEESYARLKKLYDEQRDKLSDASVEITAYTLSLKKEALKEKEDLKTKFENWQNSSKNLSRLLNTQMGANDKFGLGYGDHKYNSILSYKNEVLQSVFMNKTSDLEDTHVNDRYADGMHAVPPPMTGNYMPSRPDIEIDYSKFTYGPKQTSADESDSILGEYASCESDSSVETSTSMHEQVENAPKVVCEPKVWTDAPIIEEYESDSNNDSVSNVQDDKEKPSFAFIDFVKHVKTSRENIKETGTNNHSPKIEKQDRNGHTRKGLGYSFTRKACFFCGSFSHLIRDCDFHEKRMAKQAELTKSKYQDDPHRALKDKGIIDSGCSRHMTENKAHTADYQEFKGGSVAFGGSNERITGKRKIKSGRLDFENVYYVEELKHYNLFSMSQMCDKKNKVLFTDTDCLVLSPDFKLLDENQKGKQHKASFKAKTVSFVNQPLQILHMDLFGPTSDETTPILKDFIRQAENQFNHKIKTIRSDNGTKFKNNDLIEFCGLKGIKREYSNARTPQKNKVAETGPLLRLLELF
nr:hypothetical protein [Tanacetum cinerariifolium]